VGAGRAMTSRLDRWLRDDSVMLLGRDVVLQQHLLVSYLFITSRGGSLGPPAVSCGPTAMRSRLDLRVKDGLVVDGAGRSLGGSGRG
jgi:hypothetical protein